MPVITFDLFVDQYADFVLTPVWYAGGLPASFAGATAQLMVRQNPGDASPLISISTTPNAQGSLYLAPLAGGNGPGGYAPPGGIQINIANAALVAAVIGAGAPPPGFSLNVFWPGGLRTPYASGYVRVGPGFAH